MGGPNHAAGCDGTDWRYSGNDYNRVKVCACGAEDPAPTRESIASLFAGAKNRRTRRTETMTSTLQALYDSEINCLIESEWDAG